MAADRRRILGTECLLLLFLVDDDPLNIDAGSEITLNVHRELADVFDGTERVVGVVIQRPYMRPVSFPTCPRQHGKSRASQAGGSLALRQGNRPSGKSCCCEQR
jgi:hypothetical protein